MNNEEKVTTACAAAITVVCAVVYVKSIVRTRREIKKIEADTQVEISAINRAADRIHERIRAGVYSPGQMQTMLTDFEFERIAIRFED